MLCTQNSNSFYTDILTLLMNFRDKQGQEIPLLKRRSVVQMLEYYGGIFFFYSWYLLCRLHWCTLSSSVSLDLKVARFHIHFFPYAIKSIATSVWKNVARWPGTTLIWIWSEMHPFLLVCIPKFPCLRGDVVFHLIGDLRFKMNLCD
jgi:hypothetical protein